MFSKRLSRFPVTKAGVFTCGLLFAVVMPAQALVLDWNTVSWTTTWGTGTSASQTFNSVNGSNVNVTVAVTAGGTATNADIANTTATPVAGRGTISHSGDTQSALMVDVDYSDRRTDYLIFTITFSRSVTGVNFDLWDIDLGNNTAGVTSTYQDVVSNFKIGGVAAAPALTLLGGLTSTVNGVNYSTIDGGNTSVDAALANNGTTTEEIRGIRSNGANNGYGQENDAFNSGDVNVNFGNTALTSVSFEYRSGDGTSSGVSFGNNPTLQRIALANISFVPEVFSGGGALIACGFAVVGSLLGRSRIARG